MNIKINSKVIS